jgi:hypothetical protein
MYIRGRQRGTGDVQAPIAWVRGRVHRLLTTVAAFAHFVHSGKHGSERRARQPLNVIRKPVPEPGLPGLLILFGQNR